MIVSPSGSLLRLKSSILEFSLLDSSLHFQDRAVPLENLRATVRKREEIAGSTDGGPGDLGTAPPAPLGDQMILVVSCERGATCFSLPSQRQIYSYKSQDSQVNLTAQTVAWLGDKKTTSVLLLFTSEGRVKGEILECQSVTSPRSPSFSVLSLPRFRPLLEASLVPHMNARVTKTLRFSTGGLGTYFSNQNQVNIMRNLLSTITVSIYHHQLWMHFCYIFVNAIEVISNILNIKRYSGSEVFRQQRGNQELE